MLKEATWTQKAIRIGTIFSLLLVPLALIPILAGWVGDIAKEWIVERNAVSPDDLWLLGLSVFGLLAAAVMVVLKGRRLLPTSVLVQSPTFEPRKVVIALLSPCTNLRRDASGHWEVADGEGRFMSLAGKSLEELAAPSSGLPQWPWQQTLRAAHFQGNRLQRLVLVGSRGEKGSGTEEQLRKADEFFSTWFPGKVRIFGAPTLLGEVYDSRWQADFEDLSGLTNLLRNVLRELHRDAGGFKDRDIIIDCTGGFKVASIAAALVTLDRQDLMFQYVNNAGHVTGFDVATEYYGS